ncbi:MAG TPA: DUF2723 domain-containing protein [bacterium]|nr:DUF2723 domain-containing protein [bacterium]
MKKLLYKNYFWFILIFFVTLAVYIFTLCPTIYLEDSAEFVTVAKTLGIAHPSGYPLYILIGKLFTFLPFGSSAFQVNLMSAFFASLTSAFLFLILQRIISYFHKKKSLIKNIFILEYLTPATSALIFAFTGIFWSQSVVAEVYTLNAFLLAAIIYLLLVWQEKIQIYKNHHTKSLYLERENYHCGQNDGIPVFNEQDDNKKTDKLKNKADKILLFCIFLFGLSLANHQMMLLLGPTFFLFVILNYWRIIKDYKFIFAGAFLFFLGLSLYLYLPIRAYQNPAFNWGNPQNVEGFKNQIFRLQYNDLKFSTAKFFDAKKLPLVDSFFQEILAQFTLVGVIIAFIGFLVLYFKDKKIFLLVLGIFLSNSLLIILLRATEYSAMNEFFFRVYYLPAFMMVAIFFALGLWFILSVACRVLNKFKNLMRSLVLGVIILLLILLPISFVLNNWHLNDRSDFWLPNDWARATLNSLDRDAYVLIYNDQPALDSMIFSLYYMQAVEHLRTDVKLVGIAGIRGIFYNVAYYEGMEDFFKWTEPEQRARLATYLWNTAQKDNYKSAYLLYPLNKTTDDGLVTRSNGLVYKIYKNLDEAKKAQAAPEHNYNFRNIVYQPLEFNVYYSDFVSDYFLAQSCYYMESGQKDLAVDLLVSAIKYDASPISLNYQSYISHRSLWLGEIESKKLFKK